ncbi:actin filament-associated protein 1-like 2 [Narcine bancroftii]|uniref:actin filament-associated protein 1-like 2 n=1 Tax=Narcine bancroftii TaxID=1343680 RepID=UPI003831DCD6
MDKEKDLTQLFSELQAFLQVLETESLSGAAESKKAAVAELLQDLNGSACAEHSGFIAAEDADYMFMSCVTPLEDRAGTQFHLKGETQNALQIIEDLEDVLPIYPLTDEFQVKETQASPPPVPARHHQDITEDSYEEAEPHSPVAQFSPDQADSDSSHYESYGEEEASVTGSPACPSRPLSGARICGLLWRRQWLGRWSKQLFLIKDQVLMCYKCTKDQYPLMAIHLHKSRVLYKFKRSKKIQHQLKITTASNETVVLGLQSCEEAEDWRKIIEEVSNCTHYRSTPWDMPKVHKSTSHKASPQLNHLWLPELCMGGRTQGAGPVGDGRTWGAEPVGEVVTRGALSLWEGWSPCITNKKFPNSIPPVEPHQLPRALTWLTDTCFASLQTALRAARSLDLDRFAGEVVTVGAASRGTAFSALLSTPVDTQALPETHKGLPTDVTLAQTTAGPTPPVSSSPQTLHSGRLPSNTPLREAPLKHFPLLSWRLPSNAPPPPPPKEAHFKPFDIYINYLDDNVVNWISKFADDTKIGAVEESEGFQSSKRDLDQLEKWAEK